MIEQERVKLLRGPYHPPKNCKIGGWLRCAIRGKVEVAGMTDGPIPWPYTTTQGGRPMILCGDLAKAVRAESVVAIMHHFGVGDYLVWRWRNALGVDAVNEGTSELKSRWAPETIRSEATTAKCLESMKRPERGEKIAATKRSKPRPRHVIEAMREANLGRKASDETRAKLSAANKRRGTIPPAMKGPPWTADEDSLLGTMLDREVAERIGRSESAVSDRRYILGIPAFTKRARNAKPVKWTAAREGLLGTMPDGELARKLRCTPMQVLYRRRSLGIPAFVPG